MVLWRQIELPTLEPGGVVELPSAVLAEIARARRAAGLPNLTELQAATTLRDLSDLRALPEQSAPTPVPRPRRPRRSSRVAARWWALR
jgi:hypothetical protein